MSTPATTPADPDIAALRRRIDGLDARIVTLIGERTAISHEIGGLRRAAGGPRVVHSREMVVLDRFRGLGREGHDIAMALLRLGRGRLGHPAPAADTATSRAS